MAIRTLEIANIVERAGGARRAWGVLRERRNTSIDCSVLFLNFNLDEKSRDILKSCNIYGVTNYRKTFLQKAVPGSVKAVLFFNRYILRNMTFKNYKKFDLIISHHENPEVLRFTVELGNVFNIPKMAIFQLPPFYVNKNRINNIRNSYILFNLLTKTRNIKIEDILYILYGKNINILNKFDAIATRTLLNKFDILVAVSKSIPHEMGYRNVVSLDPGSGFTEYEINFLKTYKNKYKNEFKFHAIYSARFDPSKGIADMLLAVKLLSRIVKGFKAVVTGSGSERRVRLVRRAIKRLGIEGSIEFKGYVGREELSELRRKSMVMIYPSHVDAYPYSVMESLALGRPVVAYDIPAISMNFGNIHGVHRVKEGDVEALATTVANVIEKREVEAEEPELKTFHEIALQERRIMEYILNRL